MYESILELPKPTILEILVDGRNRQGQIPPAQGRGRNYPLAECQDAVFYTKKPRVSPFTLAFLMSLVRRW
jgi:hypothetical protein